MLRKRVFKLSGFVGVLLFVSVAAAQDPPAENPLPLEGGAGLLRKIGDHFYRETTENLVSLSENLDSFFPNPDNRRFDYRRTRLQGQLGLQVDSHGDLFVLQRVSGRVVLPRMQERLSLYFSGSGEDAKGGEEDADSNLFFVPTIEDTHFRVGMNTALRFVFTQSDIYLLQNHLGVRLLPMWDPYDEFSGQLRIPLGKSFLWQPGQALFWRESTGFGETSRYDLDYAFGLGAIFRLHQEGTISQESNGYEHGHSLAFLHQLSGERGYAFALEARGETSPIQRMTQYLAAFTWKELIYKDWLYAETGVKLYFKHEEDFEPLPAVFFSVITDFYGKKSSPLPARLRDEGVSESPL